MNNLFSTTFSKKENTVLVFKSRERDNKSLIGLVNVHRLFIYNVTWKMTIDKRNAADLTQDVLIKVISRLFPEKQAAN